MIPSMAYSARILLALFVILPSTSRAAETLLPHGAELTYTLPIKARVSLNIIDSNGWICRELVRAEEQEAGEHTLHWDGRDASNLPLPAGSYSWKLLYHTGLKADYLLSVANSGQPPYRTDDGTGSWGGCHGNPLSARADASGLYLTWRTEEGNAVFTHTNYDGQSLYKIHNSQGWGRNYDSAVVSDILYRLECGPTGSFILKYDIATGKTINWEMQGGQVSKGQLRIEKEAKPLPDKNAKKNPDEKPGDYADAQWLAANHNYIAASFPNLNKVSIFKTNGEVLSDLTIDQPRGLLFLPDGRLLAASGKTILAVHLPDGKQTPFLTKELESTTGLALSADGKSLWVTDQGLSQQVKQFSLEGKLLQSIGKPGGKATQGPLDAGSFYNPRGIACGTEKNIYVTEDNSLRRITRWSSDGKLLREWFGPLGPQRTCWPNLDDFSEVYYQTSEGFVQCQVDLKEKTWKPVAWYTVPLPNGTQPYVFRNNGHKFLYDDRSTLYLYHDKLDRWMPAVSFKSEETTTTLSTDLDGDGAYGTGEVQSIATAELRQTCKLEGLKLGFGRIDPKTFVMNVVATSDLARFEPAKITEQGIPVYQFDHIKRSTRESGFGPDRWCQQMLYSLHGALPAADGGIYTVYNGGRQGKSRFWDRATWNYLVKFSPDGRMLWRVGQHLPLKARNPAQSEMFMRVPGMSHGVIFITDIEAQFHAYTDDGLYVGWLMDSDYEKHPLTPNSLCVENVSGLVTEDSKTGETLLFSGSTEDARIWRLSGFDSLKRLEGKIVLKNAETPGSLKVSDPYPLIESKAPRKMEPNDMGADAYLNEPEWNGASVLPIVRDGLLQAEIKIRYDDKYLWIGADVLDDSPALNASQDAETAFVRGDCVDLYFGADASLSSKRDTGGPGDLRVVLYPSSPGSMYNGSVVFHRLKVAPGTAKKPFAFESPAGSVAADSVTVLSGKDEVTRGGLCTFHRWANGHGYTAEAKIPLQELPELGKIEKGRLISFDAGIIFSNPAGDDRAERLYWHQENADTQCIRDLPTEAQIYPKLWGSAVFSTP